jgi:hypothetical protein
MIPFSKQASLKSMVGFPLLLIPLAVFNIIIFLMPSVSMTEPLFRLTLMSGAEWPVTLSDMLLALGMLLLLLEVIKGARPGAKFFMDHLLSLLVSGAAAAEFLLWPKFASSTYFLLALLAWVDFLSGIALRARRSVRYAPAPAPPAPYQPPAPQPAPAPAAPSSAASRPPAASASESPAHPAPERTQPATPDERSPQLASPEPPPGNAAPGSPDAPPR